MKAFKLIGAAAAALALLTSCLGEGNNSFTNQSFGVGGVSKSYKPVLNTSFGALYSPTANVLPDVCYYAAFEVDLSSVENEKRCYKRLLYSYNLGYAGDRKRNC